MPRHEVIERVLTLGSLDPEELDAYAFRLTELNLTPAELRFIAASMTEIARKTETATPEVKGIVDRALLRLLRLLPAILANKFARPYSWTISVRAAAGGLTLHFVGDTFRDEPHGPLPRFFAKQKTRQSSGC